MPKIHLTFLQDVFKFTVGLEDSDNSPGNVSTIGRHQDAVGRVLSWFGVLHQFAFLFIGRVLFESISV